MINESKEEVEYLMGKFYEYRMLAAEAGANGADAEYKDFSDRAMEYYERAMGQMDADAAEMERNDKMVADYEDNDANREMNKMDADMYRESKNNNKMNEVELNRWAKLAGINEEYSSTDFDTYKIGDQIELNPKYFTAFEMPDGYVGTVTNINQADYADETPVYTVKLKNIDPFGDEHEDISVEYKQVK
jgi:hypothetical protein